MKIQSFILSLSLHLSLPPSNLDEAKNVQIEDGGCQDVRFKEWRRTSIKQTFFQSYHLPKVPPFERGIKGGKKTTESTCKTRSYDIHCQSFLAINDYSRLRESFYLQFMVLSRIRSTMEEVNIFPWIIMERYSESERERDISSLKWQDWQRRERRETG